MKHLKFIFMFLMLSVATFAADEIAVPYITGQTLYLCRFQPDGDVFLADGLSDEVWGTGGRDADDYDIPMTESGTSGMYVGSFDALTNIGSGKYRVFVFVQNGGSPADSDGPALWYTPDGLNWSGTAEIPFALQTDISDAHSTTDALITSSHSTTDGKIDTTDALITSSHSTTDGKIDTTDALITSSHSTTDGKIDTTDALITSSHSTTDGLITTVDTVVDSILVLATFMRDIMEGDDWIDTAPTPWQVVTSVKDAGGAAGGAELVRKDLKTISDVDVTSSNQRIDRTVEP